MPTRTSLTHPLKIDAMPCGGGILGMTLCPGKQVNSYPGGRWERDLALDMRVITDWGATTLVSLLEEHELAKLGVPELGEVAERGGARVAPPTDPGRRRPGRALRTALAVFRPRPAQKARVGREDRSALPRRPRAHRNHRRPPGDRVPMGAGRPHCGASERLERIRSRPLNRKPTSYGSGPMRRTTSTPTGSSAACWAARSATPSATRWSSGA